MFKTKALEIRTLSTADVSLEYVGWLQDPKINEYLESRHQTHTLSSVTEFVLSIDQSPESLLFGIFLLASGDHIGNIKISGIDFQYGSGEIGYLIGNHHVWGKGYATEAIVGISEFAFSVLKLKRLTAGAYPANLGSIRVLEKCGFNKLESRLSRLESGTQESEVFRFALMKPT